MARTTGNDSGELKVHQKEELQHGEGTREGTYFKPDVDIYETDDALMVVADVPGTTAGDVEIDLRDNMLTITGAVDTGDTENWEALYTEYRTGHFTRQFRLGHHIDQSNITAELNDGVLRLTLPKAESATPRKIEVTTS